MCAEALVVEIEEIMSKKGRVFSGIRPTGHARQRPGTQALAVGVLKAGIIAG